MSDLKEINALVNESGNSFHCRVINCLKNKGWDVLVSPYYMDNATNKPREIDLIAEKSWNYKNQLKNRNGDIIIKLFIECKYIPQPNVFWFSQKDTASAKRWVITNTPLRENNMFTERHHYLATNPKVAKLFASKNKPNTENEVIYKALNQTLNAMVYLRGRQSIRQKDPEHFVPPVLTIVEIPVILCNRFSDFYQIDMEVPGEPKPIEANFQLEVNYAYYDQQKGNKTEYFLIDIVDFEKIDNFLNVLDADREAIFQIL